MSDKKQLFFAAWEMGKLSGQIARDIADPDPNNETQPIPGRKFALDVAWPHKRVGVEIQGGVANRGKHGRLAGYETDCTKNNLALLNSWQVFAFTPQMIERDPIWCVQVVAQALLPEPLWADYLALKWNPMTGRVPKLYKALFDPTNSFATINHMVLGVVRDRTPDGWKLRVDLVQEQGGCSVYYATYKRSLTNVERIQVSDDAVTPHQWRVAVAKLNNELIQL